MDETLCVALQYKVDEYDVTTETYLLHAHQGYVLSKSIYEY